MHIAQAMGGCTYATVFSSKTWRTLDSHATPVGDIYEGNAYSAYLFSQVYIEFGFQNISFLYMYLYFRLYIFILPVLCINAPETAIAQ